jgi:hypothetical protein
VSSANSPYLEKTKPTDSRHPCILPLTYGAAMATVLIVDGDPSHLEIYSWMVERGGFRPLTALVRGGAVELPTDGAA